MRINLDLELNSKLSKVINDNEILTEHLKSAFHHPSQKGREKKEANAYNCLCAGLDRIKDTVKHLNNLEIDNDSEDGLYAFYDFLNYSQTLIDCIQIIGNIFNITDELKKEIRCFKNIQNKKGTDEKYFKYLRSLCTIHPIETSYHSDFQGKEPEWCPYVLSTNSIVSSLRKYDDKKPDFIAVVYRNDVEFSKRVPIYLEELFTYVQNRYTFIKTITKKAEQYYSNEVNKLKEKHILLPDECEDYEKYLKELAIAMEERYETSYAVRICLTIIKTTYEDKEMQRKLDNYKSALKQAISIVHQQIQNMEYEGFNLSSLEMKSNNESKCLKGYVYEVEKINQLCHSELIENFDSDINELINENNYVNKDFMKQLLFLMNEKIKKGLSHEKLSEFARLLDYMYSINFSEWARIQLKIMENFYSKYVKFDYGLNDWHLYLQFVVANWMLSRK